MVTGEGPVRFAPRWDQCPLHGSPCLATGERWMPPLLAITTQLLRENVFHKSRESLAGYFSCSASEVPLLLQLFTHGTSLRRVS